jgi:hypothetical protein
LGLEKILCRACSQLGEHKKGNVDGPQKEKKVVKVRVKKGLNLTEDDIVESVVRKGEQG